MDFLESMFAMSEDFEQDGRRWLVLQTVRREDNGKWVMCCEYSAPTPTPVVLMFKKKDGDA